MQLQRVLQTLNLKDYFNIELYILFGILNFIGYYADVANFGYGVVGKFGHLLGVSDAERAFGRRLIRQQFNFARSG